MSRLFFIVLLLMSINTYGQEQSIDIRGGIVFSNKSSDDFLNGSEFRRGFLTGFNYEYHFSNNYSIGLGFIFNQRGFSISSEFTDVYGNPTGGQSELKFNYSYLNLPIKGGYSIGDRLQAFFNIGFSPNILIEAKHVSPSYEVNDMYFEKETYDVRNKVSDLSLSGLVEMGASYKISDITLFTSIVYSHDITTFSNDDYFRNTNLRHIGLSFSVGLKYRIKNNNRIR